MVNFPPFEIAAMPPPFACVPLLWALSSRCCSHPTSPTAWHTLPHRVPLPCHYSASTRVWCTAKATFPLKYNISSDSTSYFTAFRKSIQQYIHLWEGVKFLSSDIWQPYSQQQHPPPPHTPAHPTSVLISPTGNSCDDGLVRQQLCQGVEYWLLSLMFWIKYNC